MLGEMNIMESIKKENKLQDNYIGEKTAGFLAIDYDENQILTANFSHLIRKQRRAVLKDAK